MLRTRLGSEVVGCVLVLIANACAGSGDRLAVAALDSANSRIDSLGQALSELRTTVAINDLLASSANTAFLTPGSDGYSLVHADIGVLTVSIKDVQPYASGARITLQFGNTTSATINGLTATLEWGQADTTGAPVLATSHSKKVTLVESLRSGAWTDVSFSLDGVPASQFGFVRVRDVAHTGVSLRR